MSAAWSAIDHLLALDPGARGIAGFFTPGAALAAAGALSFARRVLIVTGFNLAADMPETDGPPGAAVLGRALRALGARVSYVTDPIGVPIIKAALKALDETAEVIAYPDDAGAAPRVLAHARPTHLVAIERPGRAQGGDYLSARAESVAPWNRPLDELFVRGERRDRGVAGSGELGVDRCRSKTDAARRRAPIATASRRPVTVGVGDGGNEIGMGNVRAKLVRQGPLMARIASVVRVDHLVVAGTSNWGAYGIVAALETRFGRSLLHTPAVERRLVEACVEAGAVDGITRRREVTVDGLPIETHAAVVELLGLAASVGPRPDRRRRSR